MTAIIGITRAMPQHMPKLSITIPTYNRLDVLQECLDSLRQQSLTAFECFVVDDGSDDGTVAYVEDLAASDERFHLLQIRGGAVSGRNAGFGRASAPILVTFDDDVELVDSETLSFIHEQFQADDKLGVMALSEYNPNGRGKDGRDAYDKPHSLKVVRRDTTMYKAGHITRWGWIGARFVHLPFGEIYDVDHVRSSSMAIRKAAFEAVNGFYEPYKTHGIGYRYETDFCVRVKHKGYRIAFAAVHPQTLHKAAPRKRGWDRGEFDENYLIYTNRNNTFFFLRNYWHPLTAWIFLLWDILVGNTTQPGLIRYARQKRYLPHRRRKFKLSVRGKLMGWGMYWRYILGRDSLQSSDVMADASQ